MVAILAAILGGLVASSRIGTSDLVPISDQVDNTYVTLQVYFDLTGLTPGDATPVTFAETNTGPTGTRIRTLTTTVDVTPVTGATCPAGSFTMDGPYQVDFEVKPGDTDVVVTRPHSADPLTGSLSFVNLPGQNQGGCKGADVAISVSAN